MVVARVGQNPSRFCGAASMKSGRSVTRTQPMRVHGRWGRKAPRRRLVVHPSRGGHAMPELHLRDRLPELKLPEMSRDDIAKALGEARRELVEVRKDLNEFRKEFEV